LKGHNTLINQERSLWWKGQFAARVEFIGSVGGENSPKGQGQRQAELLNERTGGYFLNGKDAHVPGGIDLLSDIRTSSIKRVEEIKQRLVLLRGRYQSAVNDLSHEYLLVKNLAMNAVLPRVTP
jgi:hypothetical protein